MQIPILIEPIAGGRFRAQAGEPFAATAEADSAEEALRLVERRLQERVRAGARCAVVELSLDSVLPFPADDLYKTDEGFRALQEIIAENRKAEDEAESRLLAEEQEAS